jgi:8-oxo-dGTP pyrophosphatase MutT (NUDIX family)
MKEYSCGFIFDISGNRVLLIKKKPNSPTPNLWNGIGGRLEVDETIETCMVRETKEELGIDISEENWHKFAILTGQNIQCDWKVHFFRTFSNKITEAKQMENEEISIFQVKLLPDVVPNVNWLISMALNIDSDSADSFIVQERY